MDLIYARNTRGYLEDIGVLNNYTIDISFGENENNFKLTVPIDGTELFVDMFVYFEGTEYGGIIDAIEVDTEAQEYIYTGRTWHGILENKIIYPEKGKVNYSVEGDANAVLADLLERMNIIAGAKNELMIAPKSKIMSASKEDSGIYISENVTSEGGNYAHGYSFIRDLLYKYNAKPQIIDGVISAIPLVDYTNDEDFLEGTDKYRVKRTYNGLNRIHCLGKEKDDGTRYEIDLYLDENGGVLPFMRYMDDESKIIGDESYYTDLSALPESSVAVDRQNYEIIKANMVSDLNEIAEIYDAPSAGDTPRYLEQETEPSNWSADLTPEVEEISKKKFGFQNYYMLNDEMNFEAIKKPSLEDAYRLKTTEPAEWAKNYNKYFYIDSTSGEMKKVESESRYQLINTEPEGWYAGNFENYFVKVNSTTYEKVSRVDHFTAYTAEAWQESVLSRVYVRKGNGYVKLIGDDYQPQYDYVKLEAKPPNWKDEYNKYYTTDGVTFKKVSGDSYDKYEMQTRQPSDWETNWGSYYILTSSDFTSKGKKNAKKQQFISLKEALDQTEDMKQAISQLYRDRIRKEKDKKKQKALEKELKNTLKTIVLPAPEWSAGGIYTKTTLQKPPIFDDEKKHVDYYRQVLVPPKLPPFNANTYFFLTQEIPTFQSNTFYEKVNYPAWRSDKYYEKYKYQPIPTFGAGVYEKRIDHFYQLITGAIKKFFGSDGLSDLDIKLDNRILFNINDRIGVSDEITGVSAKERIIQKIIRVERGIISYSYKTGR